MKQLFLETIFMTSSLISTTLFSMIQDTRNVYGQTPLHITAIRGDYETIERLLQEHADVDAVDIGYKIPLHFAARLGHLDAVKLLLEYGSDIDARSALGRTALFEATLNEQQEIIKILLENGANKTIPGKLYYWEKEKTPEQLSL